MRVCASLSLCASFPPSLCHLMARFIYPTYTQRHLEGFLFAPPLPLPSRQLLSKRDLDGVGQHVPGQSPAHVLTNTREWLHLVERGGDSDALSCFPLCACASSRSCASLNVDNACSDVDGQWRCRAGACHRLPLAWLAGKTGGGGSVRLNCAGVEKKWA